MATTTTDGNPRLTHEPINFDVDKEGRKYGILLGVVTSVYLLIVNTIYDDLPTSLRFAKHLLIIPIVWYAAEQYAKQVPDGKIFKGEVGMFFRIGIWATAVIAVLNMLISAINPDWGFEQFMNENNTFADAMMNSFFVAMETLVFVVIIGFVFLQYYKGGGSPEDE